MASAVLCRRFYEERGLPMPNGQDPRARPDAPPEPAPKPKRPKVTDDSDQISFVLEKEEESTGPPVEEEEELNDKVQKLEKPYIRTSARATILHLKKFLAKKLNLHRPEDVDILCQGEVMGKEYTLECVLHRSHCACLFGRATLAQ